MKNQQRKDKPAPRPYIGVHFSCCNAYARVYLNAAQTAFAGHCPKCARPVRVAVSEEGSPSKFWTS